jgi:Flp pilus assembly protein TadG
MNPKRRLLRRLLSQEGGQVFALFAISALGLLAMVAFVVDTGRAYVAHRHLQAAADAVATATADQLADVEAGNITLSQAEASARSYSAESGQKNWSSALPNVVTTFQGKCITINGSVPSWCNASSKPNAIVVTQAGSINTIFAKIIGINSFSMSARSTATMGGGKPMPAHIMLVVDRTGSMGWSCDAGGTKLQCAQDGIDSFLEGMDPAYDKVGLVILPPATSTSQVCQSEPTSWGDPYYVNEATYDQPSSAWVVVPLSSDYRASSTSPLNTNSSLYKAYHCIKAFGSTAYATAIDQAQAVLSANHDSKAQDVIVFFTDGEANYGPCNEQTSRWGGSSCTNNSSTYRTQPCHQAITSAGLAKSAGTWIYTIEYDANGANTYCEGWKSSGSQGGSSCNTGPGVQFPCNEVSTITAQYTLQQMASDSSKFYFEPDPGSLTTIFQDIAADIGEARLVDNNYGGS